MFPTGSGLSFIKSDKFSCVKANYVIVLKARFPFYEFYFQLLNLALNLVKIDRLRSYPAFEAKNDLKGFLKRFDYRYLIRNLYEEGSKIFNRLALCKCPYFEKPLIINWESFQINLTVPEKAMAKFVECKFALMTILRHLTWPNFALLFAAILLEKHVIFVHKNRDILSRFMLINKTFLPEYH